MYIACALQFLSVLASRSSYVAQFRDAIVLEIFGLCDRTWRWGPVVASAGCKADITLQLRCVPWLGFDTQFITKKCFF